MLPKNAKRIRRTKYDFLSENTVFTEGKCDSLGICKRRTAGIHDVCKGYTVFDSRILYEKRIVILPYAIDEIENEKLHAEKAESPDEYWNDQGRYLELTLLEHRKGRQQNPHREKAEPAERKPSLVPAGHC